MILRAFITLEDTEDNVQYPIVTFAVVPDAIVSLLTGIHIQETIYCAGFMIDFHNPSSIEVIPDI